MTGIGEHRGGQVVRQDINIIIELSKRKTILRFELTDSIKSWYAHGKDPHISILHLC